MYSLKLFTKLGTALLIGPVENYSTSSAVLFWASDECFKNSSMCRSPDNISIVFKFGQLLGGHPFQSLGTVLVKAYLSKT